MNPVREEDEAAYVDSFFLPGGILDPEDDDDDDDTSDNKTPHQQPASQGSVPVVAQNPWGSSSANPSTNRTHSVQYEEPRGDTGLLGSRYHLSPQTDRSAAVHSVYASVPSANGGVAAHLGNNDYQSNMMSGVVPPGMAPSVSGSSSSYLAPPGFEGTDYIPSSPPVTPTPSVLSQDSARSGSVVNSPLFLPSMGGRVPAMPMSSPNDYNSGGGPSRKSYARVAAEAKLAAKKNAAANAQPATAASLLANTSSLSPAQSSNTPGRSSVKTTRVRESRDASQKHLTSGVENKREGMYHSHHSNHRQRKQGSSSGRSSFLEQGEEWVIPSNGDHLHKGGDGASSGGYVQRSQRIDAPKSKLNQSSFLMDNDADSETENLLDETNSSGGIADDSKPSSATPASKHEATENGVGGGLTGSGLKDGSRHVGSNAEPDTKAPVDLLISVCIEGLRSLYEACTPLVQVLAGLVELFVPLFRQGASVFIIALFGLTNVLKYAVEEMEQNDDGAFFCYLGLYLVPNLTDFLMSVMSLPHYTPHLISTASLYMLCNGQYWTNGRRRSYNSKSKHQLSQPSDKLADTLCSALLRGVRNSLPLYLAIEGFSGSNVSFMSYHVLTRLLMAYILSLTRANLLLSPVAWVSWSIQVLVTQYIPSNIAMECSLLLFGLASVRLSRKLQVDLPGRAGDEHGG